MYQEIEINAKEVIFYVVSCMCDNKYTLRFRKNDNNEFKMSGMGFSLSNFQFGLREGGIKPFEIKFFTNTASYLAFWFFILGMMGGLTWIK